MSRRLGRQACPSNLAKALRGLILAHGRQPCPAFSILGSRTRPCEGGSVAGFTMKTQPHLEGLSARTGTLSGMASAAHQGPGKLASWGPACNQLLRMGLRPPSEWNLSSCSDHTQTTPAHLASLP